MKNKEQIRKILIEYYNTCPLCKGPTNQCRMINGNRECIACINDKGYGYSYKPKTITDEIIFNYKSY